MKPNGMMANAKHRLDMYHLLSKPWFEKIQPAVINDTGEKVFEQLNTILQQVFTYCENDLEIEYLWTHFNKLYQQNKHILGDSVNSINDVVKSMKKILTTLPITSLCSIPQWDFLVVVS